MIEVDRQIVRGLREVISLGRGKGARGSFSKCGPGVAFSNRNGWLGRNGGLWGKFQGVVFVVLFLSPALNVNRKASLITSDDISGLVREVEFGCICAAPAPARHQR